MKSEAAISAGAGLTGAGGGGSSGIIRWPLAAPPAQEVWQDPLLDGVRVWAMAAVAGLCPLRHMSGRLVDRGLAAWVVPLDRFMRALCLSTARPLQIAPPGHDGALRDEARLLAALKALQLRRTAAAREQLLALAAPDRLDSVLHEALLLVATLLVRAGPRPPDARNPDPAP